MNTYEMIAILALVGYAIYKQTRISEVTGRSRFKLAMIYAIVGVVIGLHIAHDRGTIVLLLVSFAASLVVGLIRGRRTRVWREADGRIMTQGTVFTVGLFLALVAFKFGLGTLAYVTHTPYEGGIGEILIMVGIMLAVQAEIVWRRAQALGAHAPSELVHA